MEQKIALTLEIQKVRFSGSQLLRNSEMNVTDIKKFCVLSTEPENLLLKAMDKFRLSARTYFRLLKLSRTIADLEGVQIIQREHIAESLQFRGVDGVN